MIIYHRSSKKLISCVRESTHQMKFVGATLLRHNQSMWERVTKALSKPDHLKHPMASSTSLLLCCCDFCGPVFQVACSYRWESLGFMNHPL